jgi:hypothetical protein
LGGNRIQFFATVGYPGFQHGSALECCKERREAQKEFQPQEVFAQDTQNPSQYREHQKTTKRVWNAKGSKAKVCFFKIKGFSLRMLTQNLQILYFPLQA